MNKLFVFIIHIYSKGSIASFDYKEKRWVSEGNNQTTIKQKHKIFIVVDKLVYMCIIDIEIYCINVGKSLLCYEVSIMEFITKQIVIFVI